MRRIPDASISLILTDPPYHSTKKSNISGDKSFQTDRHFLDWLSQYCSEWKRILKPNGALYCFCSSEMAARIEVIVAQSFNVLSNIVWTKPNDPGFDGWKQKMKKESLRQWYAHSERIVFAEPASEGNLHRSYFGNELRRLRLKAGLSGHKLTEMTGAYGAVNHGGAVSNWETGRNIPSREQFQRISEAILSTGNIDFFPSYEDVIRPFNVHSRIEYTDVWSFPSVRPYLGKHPAEKPSEMLEHIIESSSFRGDIILDCFSGSGNTSLAALKMGRRTIGIDIEEKWAVSLAQKIDVIARFTPFRIQEVEVAL
ncbi:DNA methyltransferase [Deinococcus sp.]|uniref:DNA methyltransferase n=1 Tax=Deinococcus sp. TaxID=47478 RepID=UPI003B5A5870